MTQEKQVATFDRSKYLLDDVQIDFSSLPLVSFLVTLHSEGHDSKSGIRDGEQYTDGHKEIPVVLWSCKLVE